MANFDRAEPGDLLIKWFNFNTFCWMKGNCNNLLLTITR